MLTDDQQLAIEKMSKWFIEKSKPYFVLSGYAGTGKSYLINKFAFEVLDLLPSQVAFCTPTGKAATVLIQDGVLNASTIHRLIYKPEEIIEKEYIDNEIVEVRKVIFHKVERLNSNLKLIIVDEISMVPSDIFTDLLSYDILILCSGDSAQLPPVSDNALNILETPDAELTQIVRQKETSKIIDVAEQIRLGRYLTYGVYGDDEVVIYDKNTLTQSQITTLMLSVDQVLCGKNVTRSYLNDLIRTHLGYNTKLPLKGEKLIAIQNNWDLNLDTDGKYCLVNGMIGYNCEDVPENYSKVAKITFQADFLNESTRNILTDKGIFESSDYYFPRNKYLGQEKRKELINRFEYAYAISCHKSQGSQFDSVLIFDESNVFGKNKHKWLYTAVTRAKKKVIILR